MRISLIVARGTNGVIGLNNRLPWHLPSDLQYFKKITLGKPIIMGRRTFESIGRPLPGRTNVVVTRNSKWTAKDVVIASSLEEACRMSSIQADLDGENEIMIIGGATLYHDVINSDMVDRLYITQVDMCPVGDAFFNAPDQHFYRLHSEDRYPEDKSFPAYSYQIWNRI